jgi:hypothetical protein
MTTIDLHARVLAEIDRLIWLEMDRRDTFGMVPSPVPESLRERAERHAPYPIELFVVDSVVCAYDKSLDNYVTWPCPDYLSICREIGVTL